MSDKENNMDFESIVKERYATKLFDGKTIPEAKLNKLLTIIRNAPSSFNIQPWKIIVISNKELKEKLSPASYNQPQINSCSHLLVFCANKDMSGNIDKLEKLMIQNNTPSDKAKTHTGVMRNKERSINEEQKLAWAQRQLYLALSNAVNGSKSLGFDSCPMEGFNPEEYSKILNLSKNLVPTVLCTIGYAADKPRQKIRFSSEDVFTNYN